MHSHPSRRPLQAALLPLLALWPLLQAQGQTPPSSPAETQATPCVQRLHTRPPQAPHAPHAPRLTAEQRERHLQKALALGADQARQLDALLSQSHDSHQPPDEARLAQLLNAEQRQRLRELQPPPPPEPPAPPPIPEPPAGKGCVKVDYHGAQPAQPAPKASSAARPAG